MRVLVLSDGYPPWDRGGAQTIAAQLARGYARRGHDVSALATVADRDDVGRSAREGVTVYRTYSPHPDRLLPYLTVHNPFAVGPCRRLLDRLAPDVVHAHNVHWLSNGCLRAAARRSIPVVKTFHDAGTVSYGELTHFVEDVPVGEGRISAAAYRVDPWYQLKRQRLGYFPLRNRRNRRCMDRCVDVGVAVSRELRRALRANGVPCDEVIHNGVDVEPFDRETGDAEAFRGRHDLGSSPVVLFGGRTGYNKGGRHLAAAFARLDLDDPPALLVTGDSAYVDRMREVAEAAGDRIVSTGWLAREGLRTAFDAATVVATPSVHLDPFPTVNLEAFAGATPVVTTRFGGARELVEHERDGLVVDPRDVDRLAAALSRLLDDPDLAAAYGAAGRRKVERSFTVEGQVDAYLDVFRELVDGPTGRPTRGRRT
ncbi:glycosyltransferase family 4 protein [Halomarina pelagica]|uniref:glycosyltransferase family 4 protein n=1 Tax=Halomarina pelagica TaxID=2961599 RepID=UPI0020C29EE7|nr:glycosyltransferase family 4 protein [Halomarina sp. BND7]